MSYETQADLSQDGEFRDRVAACAAEQATQADADLAGMQPTGWADAHVWFIAGSPGFGDKTNEEITDGDILAAVQAELNTA